MPKRLVLLAVLALIGAVQTGCRDPLAPLGEDLAVARARWEANGPASYRYDYRDVCYCAVRHLRITVTDGAVSDVEWLGDAPPLEQGPQGFTIDDLFDRLATGLAEGPADADIRFDAALGYPVQAHVDPIENAIDEEWGFVVESLVAIAQ